MFRWNVYVILRHQHCVIKQNTGSWNRVDSPCLAVKNSLSRFWKETSDSARHITSVLRLVGLPDVLFEIKDTLLCCPYLSSNRYLYAPRLSLLTASSSTDRLSLFCSALYDSHVHNHDACDICNLIGSAEIQVATQNTIQSLQTLHLRIPVTPPINRAPCKVWTRD